jgi:hypothetical protein
MPYSFHKTLLSAVHTIRNQYFQTHPSVLSLSLLVNQGIHTSRMDNNKVCSLGAFADWSNASQKCKKKWYNCDPTSLISGLDMETHVHAEEITGNPSYRANLVTRDAKEADALNSCAECSRITIFLYLTVGCIWKQKGLMYVAGMILMMIVLG